MKILFVGSTQSHSTSQYYCTGFLKLGHSVLTYDPQFFTPLSNFDRYYLRVKKHPTEKKLASVDEQIVSLCRRNRFDLLFIMAETFITAETISRVREVSQKEIQILFHSHDNVFSAGILKGEGFIQSLKQYDVVFTTKSQNVSRYRDLGQDNSHFIPSAFEPSVHHPVASGQSRLGKNSFPVGFIGTYDGSREPYLNSLGWENLRVWGNGWDRSPNFKRYRKHITDHAIYDFEFADVISHTKCCLGLLREEAEDRHTQRTFEIPACGALQIAPRNEEIQSFFEEDKEIVLFDSAEELKSKVDHYLAHDRERQNIAQAGYERCIEGHHSYLDRVQTILKNLTP